MGAKLRTYGTERNAYRILAGKSVGRRPFGRGRPSRVYNIKMDVMKHEIDCVLDSSGSLTDKQRTLAKTTINIWAP
jgi:hypothetical protein